VSQPLPAWSLAGGATPLSLPDWPAELDRAWAFGDGRGAGVRVAVVDSGIDASHPRVGAVGEAVAAEVREDGSVAIVADATGDVSGHGTACAGIIRSLAPDCELTSVRVLGADLTGGGEALIAGLRWAVEQGHHVVNMSLSTTKRRFELPLREIADEAYFRRCLLVSSAHNMPVESFPWRFASVVSVASHLEADSEAFYVNPDPPVVFFARGSDVEVAWLDHANFVVTGNSFATPHMAGMAARVLGAHPGLSPPLLKTALALSATNVGGTP
jgi:subtilisin family serine protease